MNRLVIVAALLFTLPACGWNSACQRFFLVEDHDDCWDAGPDAPANARSCHYVFGSGSGPYRGQACVPGSSCLMGQCTSIPRADGDAGLLGLCTESCTTDCSDAGFIERQHPICVGGSCVATCIPNDPTRTCDYGTECVQSDAGGICLPFVCTQRW